METLILALEHLPLNGYKDLYHSISDILLLRKDLEYLPNEILFHLIFPLLIPNVIYVTYINTAVHNKPNVQIIQLPCQDNCLNPLHDYHYDVLFIYNWNNEHIQFSLPKHANFRIGIDTYGICNRCGSFSSLIDNVCRDECSQHDNFKCHQSNCYASKQLHKIVVHTDQAQDILYTLNDVHYCLKCNTQLALSNCQECDTKLSWKYFPNDQHTQ